jgi:acyl-coenzyme A synthetase/AMP-(fatty) acid ligase
MARDLREIAREYPQHYRLGDDDLNAWLAGPVRGIARQPVPAIPSDHVAAIVFTSGSTGRPRPNAKRWGDLVAATRLAQRRFGFDPSRPASLVATVPPQHMYGLETSVLLPLLAGVSVHGGRPFFPEDIRQALTALPAPRILITTPIHLRVCVEAGLEWPELAFVISATAPLVPSLAAQSEQVFQTRILEIYGCSEAGSIASRRTLDGDLWCLYDGMRIEQETGTVRALHLPESVVLHDGIECHDQRYFKLLGRSGDLVNVAGKRASLADLNHRLNEIPGVEDGVFILPEQSQDRVGRLTALVVAPGLSESQVAAALAERVDAAFLPRPLHKVEGLPRNATGKLPRNALLALLRSLGQIRAEG